MPFIVKKLKNGVNVVLSPKNNTQAVSFLVLVKVGSRYETAAVSGAAHFVEHLMFKGTKKRPNTLVISQELDGVGADYNAFTSKDHTGYYIKLGKSNIDLAFDMVSDMIFNSILDPAEIERERGTILEEINMYEDNPMAKVGDLFEEVLFGSKSSLGRHILGTPHTIKSIKRKNIESFWRKNYCGKNIVVCVSGNFDSNNALKKINHYFGNVSPGLKNSPLKISFPDKKEDAVFKKKTNQAHLVLGFPGVSYTDKNRYALNLLSTILGGNMSSRLFIQVRERLGLCYFIRSSSDSYEDTGSFSIQAGLDLKKMEKAVLEISSVLSDIKNNGVTKDELLKAKEYAKGKIALSMEDSLDVAGFFGRQILFNKPILDIDEVINKIENVKLGDIKRISNLILRQEKAKMVAIAPFSSIKKFADKFDF